MSATTYPAHLIRYQAYTLRCPLRHFSSAQHQFPRAGKATRGQKYIAMSLINLAVLLPFVPPAVESRRERKAGYPSQSNKDFYTPLCAHAR